MLEFKNDAIILSGETGTKLKSEILGKYYQKWWEITSGGKLRNFNYITTIIEMNAATGEIYIKDLDETILGSSGHALDLQANHPNTHNLGIVLVEENDKCFERLQRVIKRNWPKLSYSVFSPGTEDNIFLMQNPTYVDDILTKYRLGNSLFFFDPLLSVSWNQVEYIAKQRIKNYYQNGTEFLIFLFTTDFFIGRNEYSPLPENNDKTSWSENQFKTVKKLDNLFGDMSWGSYLLNKKTINEKTNLLVNLYKKRLRQWFRYVLPLPFIPKESQMYHIFFCSNYELGVKLTKDFYAEYTDNPKFTPNNNKAYAKFLTKHPAKRMKRSARCSEWKILWAIIKKHEDGLCDTKCKDLLEIEPVEEFLQDRLEWLESEGYLNEINHITNAWEDLPKLYQLDWNVVGNNLGITTPPQLSPLSTSKKIKKTNSGGLDKFFE